jgi:Ser/Thr protein kinase RdoA (MazF antagonist)
MTPTAGFGGYGLGLGRVCGGALQDSWGLGRYAEAVDLGGSSSLNLLVGDAARRYVVRVHRPHVTPERLDVIHQARRALLAGGVPCAPPIPTQHGAAWASFEGRLVEVEAYVDHDAVMDSWQRLQVGMRLLAHTHSLLRQVQAGEEGRRPRFANHLERADVAASVRRGIERIRGWRLTAAERRLAAVAEELADLVTQAEAGLVARLPRQLVHGDFWDNNVLFRHGRLVLADFDFMGERARIDDLALTLHCARCDLGAEGDPARGRARLGRLVAGYDAGTYRCRQPSAPHFRWRWPANLSRRSGGGWCGWTIRGRPVATPPASDPIWWRHGNSCSSWAAGRTPSPEPHAAGRFGRVTPAAVRPGSGGGADRPAEAVRTTLRTHGRAACGGRPRPAGPPLVGDEALPGTPPWSRSSRAGTLTVEGAMARCRRALRRPWAAPAGPVPGATSPPSAPHPYQPEGQHPHPGDPQDVPEAGDHADLGGQVQRCRREERLDHDHADADQAAVDQVELPQPFLFLLRVLREPGSVFVHGHRPLSWVSRSLHRRSAAPPWRLANEAGALLDGSHPSPRVGATAARCAARWSSPAVPSPCHSPAGRHRFATVNHGHSRSSDLQPPYYRCPAARMVRMGSPFDVEVHSSSCAFSTSLAPWRRGVAAVQKPSSVSDSRPMTR